MARAVLGAEQIHGECPSHEPAALKAFCGRAWMHPTQTSSDDSTGCGICRLAPESGPGLPGLGGGRPSGSEASFAKRSTQPRLFRGSRAAPARAHEAFGCRKLLKGGHKDTFSPPWPGEKTGRPRHKKTVVSHQPAAGKFCPSCRRREVGKTPRTNRSSGAGRR